MVAAIVSHHRQATSEGAAKPSNLYFRCKIANLDERTIVILGLRRKILNQPPAYPSPFRTDLQILSRHFNLVKSLVLVLDEPVTQVLERMALRLSVKNLFVSIAPDLQTLDVLT